jgi:predicted nucleic acid binding AN1-type Zn finger protein
MFSCNKYVALVQKKKRANSFSYFLLQILNIYDEMNWKEETIQQKKSSSPLFFIIVCCLCVVCGGVHESLFFVLVNFQIHI